MDPTVSLMYPTRRQHLVVSRAGVAVALLVAVAGCGGGDKELSASEERTFRTAVEREAGAPVADWPAFIEIGRAVCDDDEETFALDVATFHAQDDLGQLKLIVRHLCPDRAPEIAVAQEELGLTP